MANEVTFQSKLEAFLKSVNDVKLNNNTPKWIKPFFESFKSFAVDLTQHLEALEGSIVVNKKVSCTLKSEVDKLRDELDDQQQYSRRTCLLLHGVKEEQREDVETKVKEVLDSKLEIKLDEKDIARTHRLGKKKDDGKPRPIIIRFLSYRQRKKVFDKKRKLKGSKIVLTENLTKKLYALLQSCKTKFGFDKVWSYDGRIYIVDDNEDKQVFTSMDQLTEYLQK